MYVHALENARANDAKIVRSRDAQCNTSSNESLHQSQGDI